MKKLIVIILSAVMMLTMAACSTTNAQADQFREDYATVLELTTDTVGVADKQAVVDAIAAYDELGEVTQAFLIEEKAMLYMLLSKIGEIENSELVTKDV